MTSKIYTTIICVTFNIKMSHIKFTCSVDNSSVTVIKGK